MNHFLLFFTILLGFCFSSRGSDFYSEGMYNRETPSGEYQDPASEFFLHGYLNGTFAAADRDFGKGPYSNHQILLNAVNPESGNNEGGFQGDVALFLGSEKVHGFQAVAELHFVRTAIDPVITEGKITWDLLNDDGKYPGLTLGFGRQWWVFGIQNKQWFAPINIFNAISPVSTDVLPPHHNESGLWLETSGHFGGLGFNFVVSFANGPLSFNLGDNIRNNASGRQSSLTTTMRLGLFPFIENLEAGFSYSGGNMRTGATPNSSGQLTDPLEYEADFEATGLDLHWRSQEGVRVLASIVNSRELLVGAPALEREGYDMDLVYDLPLPQKLGWLWSLSPKLRFSEAKIDSLSGGQNIWTQSGVGLNYRPIESALIKVEYIVIREKIGPQIPNNMFNLGFSLGW